ncbi:MAG: hypothetical protein ACU0DT_03890 [Albimonas sp.]|uniref:hypothetical protein n=1 Tax=Albimonas sp. TaxID=1872425 RepID=UPI0040576FBF|tara:strand:- start:30 stop:455 length:426 start_codon:yes stop_codon:yes gene_type:complete
MERVLKSLGLMVTAAVGLGGLAISAWNYAATQELAARRPFLERQMTLCFEASRLAAQLATSPDAAVRSQAGARFEELYWGELAIVEDAPVEQAMVAFRRTWTAGEDASALRAPALRIAHSCRELVLSSWGIDLGPLPALRP